MVNGNVSLISLSVFSLLVYRNASDFFFFFLLEKHLENCKQFLKVSQNVFHGKLLIYFEKSVLWSSMFKTLGELSSFF